MRISLAHCEPHLFDRFQTPAAALDVEDVLFLAEEAALAELDRSVAAAVQDQRRVPPQEPRGIDPQLDVRPAGGGFGVSPQALHPRAVLSVTTAGAARRPPACA